MEPGWHSVRGQGGTAGRRHLLQARGRQRTAEELRGAGRERAGRGRVETSAHADARAGPPGARRERVCGDAERGGVAAFPPAARLPKPGERGGRSPRAGARPRPPCPPRPRQPTPRGRRGPTLRPPPAVVAQPAAHRSPTDARGSRRRWFPRCSRRARAASILPSPFFPPALVAAAPR